jgi:formylglycine-generating enzyme required for sulfatase activity
MKYEAKNAGSNIPVSTATGTPFVSVSQTNAATYSANVVGCTGCHLITEAEWMTIAQNVLSVPSNWSTGTVGSGYIYSGHNDNAPSSALAAVADDNEGYNGTGNNATDATVTNGVVGKAQRRTLTLSNGQVIWDLAGNVSEWTSGTATTGFPGRLGAFSWSWREWYDVNVSGSLLPNVFPSGTNIAGASGWGSSRGIGKVDSAYTVSGLHGFIRGGIWNGGVIAGVLSLDLYSTPSSADASLGFRVSR